jgi:hypothetical protein
MKLMMAVTVWVALGASSCGVCAIYCTNMQKIVFEDASGNPLAPLQVTDGATHRCETDGGVSGAFVTCDGNSMTYDMVNTAPHVIQAQSTTGELFSGEISPVSQGERPLNNCGCGTRTWKPITIKLTAP